MNKKWEGKWDQVKGGIKKNWGKLTDDDLKQIDGNKDKLVGKLKESMVILKKKPRKKWMILIRINNNQKATKGDATKGDGGVWLYSTEHLRPLWFTFGLLCITSRNGSREKYILHILNTVRRSQALLCLDALSFH